MKKRVSVIEVEVHHVFTVQKPHERGSNRFFLEPVGGGKLRKIAVVFWGRYHLKIDAGKMTTSFAISGAMLVSGTVHGNPFLIEGSWNKLQKPT